MRKGHGELTYKQLLDENKRLRKENEKLRNEMHSRSMPKEKQTRPVVRVDEKTGDVVRFPTVKAARESIGGTSLSMNLLTNRPLKGYRFYYAEDWKDGDFG